jgi:hypothetical protein
VAIFALSLTVLIGFLGLVMDGGNAYHSRRVLQNAADAGALAGTLLLMKNRSQSGYPGAYAGAAKAEAQRVAQANGAPSKPVNVTPVDVLGNPSGGWTDTKTHGVKVDVADDFDTLFVRVVGITNYHVDATATAAWGYVKTIKGMLPMAVNQGAMSAAGLNPPSQPYIPGKEYKIVMSPAGGSGAGGENYGTFKSPNGQTAADAWANGLAMKIYLGQPYDAADINAIDALTASAINGRISRAPNEDYLHYASDSPRLGIIGVINGDIGNPKFICINYATVFLDAVNQSNQTVTLHFVDAPVIQDGGQIDPDFDPGTATYTPAIMKLVA